MVIKVGDTIPPVTFKRLTPEGLSDVTSDDIFKGKRVALIGVPGAFTPVCSAQHIPGFIKNAGSLKAKGIDTIACISVNDPFVMEAWAKALNVGDTLLMLADGNGEFSRAVGLTFDGSGFSLGERSQRYSMLVEDGVVKKLNLEESPGVLEVSGPEILLGQA